MLPTYEYRPQTYIDKWAILGFYYVFFSYFMITIMMKKSGGERVTFIHRQCR